MKCCYRANPKAQHGCRIPLRFDATLTTAASTYYWHLYDCYDYYDYDYYYYYHYNYNYDYDYDYDYYYDCYITTPICCCCYCLKPVGAIDVVATVAVDEQTSNPLTSLSLTYIPSIASI